MGSLDFVLKDVENRFGISDSKATSLLSGLLALINEQSGGLSAILDRFRRTGLGDTVSAWIGGDAKPVSPERLEEALGHNAIDGIAAKTGLPFSAAASALAFMFPKLVQKLTPGGSIPTRLPADVMGYATSVASDFSSGARRVVDTGESVIQRRRPMNFLLPLLGLLALLLIGLWAWNRRGAVERTAFNIEDQVRMAGQKATAALAALKPGFSSHDLVDALNKEIINFPTGSAELPRDSMDVLNKAAAAIKAAPAGTVIEVGGHTDNAGDPAANLQLSQQRAEAVRNYLVQQGVDSSALTAKGYGDSMPIAGNDSEEGRFRNRRITFSVAS